MKKGELKSRKISAIFFSEKGKRNFIDNIRPPI